MTDILSTEAGPVMPDRFRQVFRRHPAGVVVITTDAGRGPAGFTATSLTSLSLEPALVSFGIASTASSWPLVHYDGRYHSLPSAPHPDLLLGADAS